MVEAVCGIYQIDTVRGSYIGSSVNIKNRVKFHLWAAKTGRHSNSKLCNVLAKHGLQKASVLLICRPEDLLMYEQQCLDAFKPPLNVSQFATSVAMVPSVRAKISAALRKRVSVTCQCCGTVFETKPCFAKTRKYCSQRCAWDSKKGLSRPEVGPAISAAKKGVSARSGWTHTEEVRQRIRDKLTGRSHSPERRAAISAGRRGNVERSD